MLGIKCSVQKMDDHGVRQWRVTAQGTDHVTVCLRWPAWLQMEIIVCEIGEKQSLIHEGLEVVFVDARLQTGQDRVEPTNQGLSHSAQDGVVCA